MHRSAVERPLGSEEDAMFIQVIQGHCTDAEQMRALGDEWVEKLSPGAPGWLGGIYGIPGQGQFLAFGRFHSRQAAEENSSRPEQGEWGQRMSAPFDGPVTF